MLVKTLDVAGTKAEFINTVLFLVGIVYMFDRPAHSGRQAVEKQMSPVKH